MAEFATETKTAMNEFNTSPNRRRKRRTAGVPTKPSLPWKKIRNILPPIEPLSADEIESIHQASLRVLAELGMKVTDEEARKIYREGGARVDDSEEMVYLDPEMVEEVIKTVPPEFTQKARNPEKSVTLGGNHITFFGVGGPAFVSDLDKGRRPGTFAELCDYKNSFKPTISFTMPVAGLSHSIYLKIAVTWMSYSRKFFIPISVFSLLYWGVTVLEMV